MLSSRFYSLYGDHPFEMRTKMDPYNSLVLSTQRIPKTSPVPESLNIKLQIEYAEELTNCIRVKPLNERNYVILLPHNFERDTKTVIQETQISPVAFITTSDVKKKNYFGVWLIFSFFRQ